MIPCPTCCPSCIIATDTFDTDLAAFSTAGSPTVSGGLVEMTAGDRLIFTAAAAAVGDGVRIYGYLQKTSSDGTVRLIVAWSDSSNYLFGELAIASGAGTIRLGQRVGGSETWLTDALTVDDTSTELDALALLCLSWEPGEVQTPEEFLVSGLPTVATNGGAWASENNIKLDDGNVASFTLIGAGTTDALTGSDFGLPVPPGSVIDGIAVGIECRYTAIGATSVTLTDLLLYDRDSNQVGDDRGTGQAVGTTFGVIGSGGAADDWSAGLTWEDINSPNFAVQIRFTANGGAIIDVDFISVDIYFTSPERQPGILRITYDNTGSEVLSCLAATVENPDEGLQAGVSVSSGDFEATELHYEYPQSDSRPSCGTCGSCAVECPCCDTDAASAYTLDFGTGGAIEGEFVVNFISRFHNTSPLIDICYFGGSQTSGGETTWAVLALTRIDANCYWSLQAYTTCDSGASESSRGYEFDLDDETEDCLDPVTLTATGGLPNNADCGAMPTTVDLEPV